MKIKPLCIPANITLRFEFWKGFGKSEMLWTSVITGISLLISLALKLLFNTDIMTLTFIVAITVGAATSILQKYENTSILDYVKRSINYLNEQQQFYYKYK
ncbi:MAG: hypothetical protein RR009_06855 [Oscillospiraceae bacterium]